MGLNEKFPRLIFLIRRLLFTRPVLVIRIKNVLFTRYEHEIHDQNHCLKYEESNLFDLIG